MNSQPLATNARQNREKSAADAYLKALDFLARRDHSRGELQKKLLSRGFAATAVDTVLERLSAQKLLDDARFAANWVESALRNGRGFGPKLLLDLQQRGVCRETAQEAVVAATAETSAEMLLGEIVRKRFAAYNNETATQKERQRLYGYLQRRGFSLSTILSHFRNQHTE